MKECRSSVGLFDALHQCLLNQRQKLSVAELRRQTVKRVKAYGSEVLFCWTKQAPNTYRLVQWQPGDWDRVTVLEAENESLAIAALRSSIDTL